MKDLTKAQVIAKDGLLWRDGKVIPLPLADTVAREHGFLYAEQLVKSLEKPAPAVNWRAVVGKLLALLQASGFTLERVDDGEVTLLASGTPRQRRQQIKQVVVNSNCSHLTVSVDGKFLWLYIDLSRKPFECVTDCSDSLALEKTIQIFHQYYKNN